MTIKTFMPNGSDSATLVATTTSASVQLDVFSQAVRVVNPAGGAMAFIAFGDVTVTATTARMPIQPGATETFTIGANGYVAAITASGTATLYFTNGEGL